jgi:hypothetical protein
VRGALGSLPRQRAAILAAGDDAVQASARAFALALARLTAGALLIEHGAHELASQALAPTAAAARLWCAALPEQRPPALADERLLALGRD